MKGEQYLAVLYGWQSYSVWCYITLMLSLCIIFSPNYNDSFSFHQIINSPKFCLLQLGEDDFYLFRINKSCMLLQNDVRENSILRVIRRCITWNSKIFTLQIYDISASFHQVSNHIYNNKITDLYFGGQSQERRGSFYLTVAQFDIPQEVQCSTFRPVDR